MVIVQEASFCRELKVVVEYKRVRRLGGDAE